VQRDDARDRQLLARLAAGEREALGELYDRHVASLYRHARALAGRGPDADDVVQAVFVKLATAGAPLLGVRRPASYLHRMLWTSWVDEQRLRTARAEDPIDNAASANAGNRNAGDEERFDIELALSALPPALREIVVLHIVVGFSFREAGRIVGVGTFTAASRYRLAIARMRKTLEGRP
jgi:RNA polymerase sigma-70 factor (ECF subfamily)